MKANFKMREKKETASPSTLYRVSWVQENNPWIRDKESLKSEAAEQQLPHISYERQRQSQGH